MKAVCLSVLAVLLCGCDYSIENRQAVVDVVGTTDVYRDDFNLIARDTNGAVWVFTTSKGTITGKTKIFEATK